ncbi:MAG: hypothetical protein GX100_02170, partial [candidate division WS1 bacterium]|nr:hypothetical protein [candidate division WS1 bacterium]
MSVLAPRTASPSYPVTGRALVTGLLLSLACGLFIPYLDHFLSGTFLGAQHLPPGAIFVLMVLILVVNPVLRRLSSRLAFTRGELLVIYAMLLFSLLIPGHGSESVFVPVSVSAFYYASPANGWEKSFHQYIPPWFHPARGFPIRAFYEGLPPGRELPWDQWVVPLLAWGGLTLLLYLLAALTSALLFPQWADDEKLTFPLVALPVEMTAGPTPGLPAFWGNWVMWAGFALAALFQGLQGLKFYYPGLPVPSLYFQVAGPRGLLRAMGWIPAYVYPSVIGIGMLLRTEVAFSMVVFFWYSRVLMQVASWFGYRNPGGNISGFAFWLGGQPWGGYLAYVVLGLWTARHRLGQAWRELLGKAQPSGTQPLSYRLCLGGILLCLAGAVLWLMLAGMSLWSALVSLLLYVMIIIILSKVVAEVGLLFVQQTLTPAQALNYYFGTELVGRRSLTVGMFFDRAFATDLRATIAPSFVQGLRLAREGHLEERQMWRAFGVAILAALPLGLLSALWTFYHHGAVNCNEWFTRYAGTTGWEMLASWLAHPRPADLTIHLASLVGAASVVALYALRRQYLWFWPHPVGFIMMQSYPVTMMWFSLLIAGIVKSLVLRYGGPRVLTQVTPFFLGLAFGDVLAMAVFRFVSLATGT